jgi:hypothetical protein
MINKIFLLVLAIGSVCPSNAGESSPKWSVTNELSHYESMTNAPGCGTRVLVAPLFLLAHSTNSQAAVERIGGLISGASKFMLLQFINQENAVYNVTLAVQRQGTNRWELYKVAPTFAGNKLTVVRHAKKADELFNAGLGSKGGMDCSRYPTFDGTAAYVTIGNAAKMVHFAVYEPAPVGEKSIAVVNYESISSLVNSLSGLD